MERKKETQYFNQSSVDDCRVWIREDKMTKKVMKKSLPKVNLDEYIIVPSEEYWLKTKIGKDFYDDDYHRIIEFYVLHSPCRDSSYTPCTFESLGWKTTWKSRRFRKAFDDVPNFVENDTFRFHDSKNHFEEMWEAAGWGEFFSINGKEFAILVKAGESNRRMDILHHIRNSFAHGRFSVKKKNGEYYIYFEDVTRIHGIRGLVVNARICLKKSTLVTWLDTFEKKTDASKELSSIYLDEKE